MASEVIRETTGICRVCAQESPAWYEKQNNEIYLFSNCSTHGLTKEIVEKDLDSFLWGYDQEYQRDVSHLVLPLTYRCNLKCNYCYTMSNTQSNLPPDKSLPFLKNLFSSFKGNVTLIGGEPTLRNDLFEIINLAKEHPNIGKVSLATNGQKLRDKKYVKKIADSELDFVFLSYNDVDYDESMRVNSNKFRALHNCSEYNIPVWLQGTVSELRQVDSFVEAVDSNIQNIFNITLRAVSAVGLNRPEKKIFLSDLLKYLGAENNYKKGTSPFNRYIQLSGKKAKLCSWILDIKKLDPIDSSYVIADNSISTFHRGMILDEVYIKNNFLSKSA
jgi:uncharacterized radical SAM superfamily Fe-S cluster-containing enzyme